MTTDPTTTGGTVNTTETVPYLMGDSDLTSECVRSANSGTEIHDLAARAVAARIARSDDGSAGYPACAAFALDDRYDRGALLGELSDWIGVHYVVSASSRRQWADHLGTYLLNRRDAR